MTMWQPALSLAVIDQQLVRVDIPNFPNFGDRLKKYYILHDPFCSRENKIPTNRIWDNRRNVSLVYFFLLGKVC